MSWLYLLPASIGGGGGVVATTPQHELLVAEFVLDLGLVLTLQRTVVTLVQTPVADDGNPVTIRGVEREVRGADGAAQQRGVEHVREEVVFLEQFAGALAFCDALVGQAHVHPAGEQVHRVPFALAVAEQYKCSDTHSSQSWHVTVAIRPREARPVRYI